MVAVMMAAEVTAVAEVKVVAEETEMAMTWQRCCHRWRPRMLAEAAGTALAGC